ncbi:hypothetical protein [Aliidiomarina sanyensis]|uniref:Uncharacterized protein n=1 Tax=Aliidiomarina sanyensis TaxID=1249555 RepID=A0A432WGA2_9GAMM|nr:hypothetical protein [Aliidiomarina sanyensis]RUO32804.1 hypothetical protein CWE11_07145 [Aliidiomarina sanyensis]
MKYLTILVVAFFAVLASPITHATENCANYYKKYSSVCADYTYQSQLVWFNSTFGSEHQLFVRTSRSPSGTVVGVSLDFVAEMGGSMNSPNEAAINEVYEAFRLAYLNEGFFIYRDCDPTREICCDDYTCSEIQGEESLQTFDPQDAHQGGDVGQANWLGRVRDVITTADAGVSLFDRVVRGSGDTSDFRDKLTQETSATPKVLLVSTQGGGHFLCLDDGVSCNQIAGSLTLGEDFASAYLHHEFGMDTNIEIYEFLQNWFYEQLNPFFVCSQTMRCDTTSSCTVTLSCR